MTLRKYFAGLTVNTFLLALSSLFGDIAAEMLYPLLPVYLTRTLGAAPTVVGLVDGVSQAVQYFARGLSGWVSDRLERHKPLAVVGFVLGAVAKPLIGFAGSWWGVLAGRSLDRLGSGIRSAPRDALVAASADDAHRGKAFGLESAGDNLGACLGPLLALALLPMFLTNPSSIFFVAFIPGVFSLVMILLVREQPMKKGKSAKIDLRLVRFPRAYWAYLGVTALFEVGNSSNMYLILRATPEDASLTTTMLIYAGYNLVAAVVSYPAGHLSDTLGRRNVLLIAFVVSVVVYAGFGLTTNRAVLGGLFVFYGLYQGIFRAVGKAQATDLAPATLRASGLGWYMATVGVMELIANIVGGELWTRVGPAATFFYGAGAALLGSVSLAVFVARHRGKSG
jgi:MFS family permease